MTRSPESFRETCRPSFPAGTCRGGERERRQGSLAPPLSGSSAVGEVILGTGNSAHSKLQGLGSTITTTFSSSRRHTTS